MSCTALKLESKDGLIRRLKFMTVSNPGHIDLDIFNCNEEFIPIGEPVEGYHEMDEETYHKKLRKDASEKGQFVPEESTDHNWNPGYIEYTEEDEDQTKT